MTEFGKFSVRPHLGLNQARQGGRIHVQDANLQIHVPTVEESKGLGESHTFKNVLSSYLDQVNDLQHDADAKVQRFVAGEIEDLHEVTLAMDEAETSFLLMREMRDQLVRAYRELMSMQ